FLSAPASRLRRRHGENWELIAEGDAADRRVQDLLNSSLPGRGATKPEHWGLLGFLWARQGEASTWPELADEAVGQQIRSRLARVELDPVIERLRDRLAAIADEIVTATGKPRAGGALESANSELAAIEAALTGLASQRAEIEGTQGRYREAVAAVAQLERERGDRERAAKALAEQAAAADRVKTELEARQTELTTAEGRLQAVSRDAETLTARKAALGVARMSLTAAEEAAGPANAVLAKVRGRSDERRADRPVVEREVSELRARHRRVQALIRLRRLAADASALEQRLGRAEESAAELERIGESLGRLPAVSAGDVSKLRGLSDRVQTLRTQVDALGLTVELTPDDSGEVSVRSEDGTRVESVEAGEVSILRSPQTIGLLLPGWGKVAIRSGAADGQDAADDLRRATGEFEAVLRDAEVTSVEAAREAVAARKELGVELKAAKTSHAERLGEMGSVGELRESVEAAKRRQQLAAAELSPEPGEAALSASELESEEARLATAVPPAERALTELDAEITRLGLHERNAVEVVTKAVSEANERRGDVKTLESQTKDLADRYPDGIEGAKSGAGSEFVRAEARLKVTKDALPVDFEKLPERNRRAAVALQELLNDLQARRAERDAARGALQSLGGQGIYTRETELVEKQTEAILRRDAARARGWSARIAATLIEHRKQAATRAVLTPLEDRLSAAFAMLSGREDRRVFLDENLQIVGLGREREAAHPFETLSQGAKEQLLLCLRIAVATELASDEPQVLILDDVLVNTDAVRQERVLDSLSSKAGDLQVVILTCHPERYRGIGRTVGFDA
ncbi:MAG: hypothetical protein WA771_14740, partial [Chthoniobacterales bacterium]